MMKITVTCTDGKKREVALRAAYNHIKSERAAKAVIAKTLDGYCKQGGAWVAYAESLEKKGIIEQMSLIGMLG